MIPFKHLSECVQTEIHGTAVLHAIEYGIKISGIPIESRTRV